MSYERILVAAADSSSVDMVKVCLDRDRYDVHVVEDGPSVLAAIERLYPHLVILDIMLKQMDGLAVSRELRRRVDNVPILIVSDRSEVSDRVLGLEVADDYVTRPFDPQELTARVRALVRRFRCRPAVESAGAGALPRAGSLLRQGPIHMDVARHRVEVRGREVELTPTEFAILRVLLENVGIVMSRQELVVSVWGHDYEGRERNVDTHVGNLRAKLCTSELRAVRGWGYRLGN